MGVSVGRGVSVGSGVSVCTKAIAPCKLVTSSAANVEIKKAGATMHTSQTKSIATTTNRTLAPRLRLPNHPTRPLNDSPSSDVRLRAGSAVTGRGAGFGLGARRGRGATRARGTGVTSGGGAATRSTAGCGAAATGTATTGCCKMRASVLLSRSLSRRLSARAMLG